MYNYYPSLRTMYVFTGGNMGNIQASGNARGNIYLQINTYMHRADVKLHTWIIHVYACNSIRPRLFCFENLQIHIHTHTVSHSHAHEQWTYSHNTHKKNPKLSKKSWKIKTVPLKKLNAFAPKENEKIRWNKTREKKNVFFLARES